MKKEILFQTMTDSFREHHPNFPWPKKYGLEDQTKEFQAAFECIRFAVATANEIVLEERLKANTKMHENLLKKKRDIIAGLEERNANLRRKAEWRLFVAEMLAALLIGLGVVVIFSLWQQFLPGCGLTDLGPIGSQLTTGIGCR